MIGIFLFNNFFRLGSVFGGRLFCLRVLIIMLFIGRFLIVVNNVLFMLVYVFRIIIFLDILFIVYVLWCIKVWWKIMLCFVIILIGLYCGFWNVVILFVCVFVIFVV